MVAGTLDYTITSIEPIPGASKSINKGYSIQHFGMIHDTTDFERSLMSCCVLQTTIIDWSHNCVRNIVQVKKFVHFINYLCILHEIVDEVKKKVEIHTIEYKETELVTHLTKSKLVINAARQVPKFQPCLLMRLPYI